MRKNVKTQFRMFSRHGIFYCEDAQTRKQQSLKTRDRREATRLLHARNEAQVNPAMNLQIARAYLQASDPNANTRTWHDVMQTIIEGQTGSSQLRWRRAAQAKPFDGIRDLPILETQAQHFLKALENGGVSANVYLRRLQNYALGMNWLPWPVIPRKQWPPVRYGEKRAITWAEHCRIVDREKNPERRAFYQLAWHLGASQADLANLQASDIDWDNRVISFERMKTRWRGQQPPQVRFGAVVENILTTLPRCGPLFPYLRSVRSGDRATEFKQRVVGLGITGVSLHSYRYAWAERAKTCGYPERFAQQALGHNSKAVHRAYARKAQVIVPALDEYEQAYGDRKIIPMRLQMGETVEAREVRPIAMRH